MTREEKQKAIDALKISAPVMAMTQEEFNDYIRTLNKVTDWLEQEPCEDCYDIPFDEILEQARQAVKDLRKKSAERSEQQPILDKIKSYVTHIRNTGIGKKKSLEYIEKFIEGYSKQKRRIKT